jgi:large subunit ribosomal protein L21
MFAIIETGGKQYKIEKGQTLDIEKIEKKIGDSITFDKILLIGDKGKTTVGTPIIEGAYATAKILTHNKNDKIVVFKMKSKKRYERTKGHRQKSITIEITDVKASGGTSPAKKEEKAEVQKETVKKTTKKPSAKKTTAPAKKSVKEKKEKK